MENPVKAFLDQYYPSFTRYAETGETRDDVHRERLEIGKKLEVFVKNDFPMIIRHLEDESMFSKVYEIFDTVARNSFQAGRQHYLSFFGAKRYYEYAKKAEEPSSKVQAQFQGLDVRENIRKLGDLLSRDLPKLPMHFTQFLKIQFVGWNLTTAFLMYQNPKEFLMVNRKTLNLFDKLGIRRPRDKSYGEYERVRQLAIQVIDFSKSYFDGGFRDFLDMDWFGHLLAVGELKAGSSERIGMLPSKDEVERAILSVGTKVIDKNELFSKIEEIVGEKHQRFSSDWREVIWLKICKEWCERTVEQNHTNSIDTA